jgi:hypothetical protein
MVATFSIGADVAVTRGVGVGRFLERGGLFGERPFFFSVPTLLFGAEIFEIEALPDRAP